MDTITDFLTTPSWMLLIVSNVAVLLLSVPLMGIAKRNAKKSMKYDPQSGTTAYAATTVAGWYIKPLSYGVLVLINGFFTWNMWLDREALSMDEMVLAASFAIITIFFLMLFLRKLFAALR